MSKPDCFQRVNQKRPCPVCGKPDWCLVAADGSAALCPRVEHGAARRCGDAGWLHRFGGDGGRQRRGAGRQGGRVKSTIERAGGPAKTPRHDYAALARRFAATAGKRVSDLAMSLGASAGSLERLGVGWSHSANAWTFPMSDAGGTIRGIRLRLPSGRKLALRGGREGLFIPDLATLAGAAGGSARSGATRRLMVCEGPTDTAALMDLDFAAVGRPSCTGGCRLLVDLVQLRSVAEVVIVADADEPGRRGADALASALLPYCPAVRVICPPAGVKDARAWKQAGATRADVEAAIRAASVRRLTIGVSVKGGRVNHV